LKLSSFKNFLIISCGLCALISSPSSSPAQLIPFSFLNLNTTCRAFSSSWTPLWSNVIEYWRLNGTGAIANGASIPATVGTAGTANSTAMTYTTGKINSTAVSLSGSDYITMGSLSNIQGLAKFAISGWIKPANLSSQSTFLGSELLFKLQITTSGNVNFFVSNDGSSWAASPSSSVTIPAGSWTHVAGVYDGAHAIIYINGVSKGSGAMTGTTSSAGNDFQISGFEGGNENFVGVVDEVAIWNTSLTAAQVLSIYNSQACSGH